MLKMTIGYYVLDDDMLWKDWMMGGWLVSLEILFPGGIACSEVLHNQLAVAGSNSSRNLK